MSVRGILFDAGDTLYAPIGGRWNPRFDFEEVLLRYHPEVPVDRFAEAIAAGRDLLIKLRQLRRVMTTTAQSCSSLVFPNHPATCSPTSIDHLTSQSLWCFRKSHQFLQS